MQNACYEGVNMFSEKCGYFQLTWGIVGRRTLVAKGKKEKTGCFGITGDCLYGENS